MHGTFAPRARSSSGSPTQAPPPPRDARHWSLQEPQEPAAAPQMESMPATATAPLGFEHLACFSYEAPCGGGVLQAHSFSDLWR